MATKGHFFLALEGLLQPGDEEQSGLFEYPRAAGGVGTAWCQEGTS